MQGRLTKANGDPILGTATAFTIKILTPTPANNPCTLYAETQTVDLSTNGYFNVSVNGPNSNAVSGNQFSFAEAISNAPRTMAVQASSCKNTTATNFTPVMGDSRRLSIAFFDSTSMTAEESIDPIDISAAAYAIEASALTGIPSSSLLRSSDGTNVNAYTSAQISDLDSIIKGTSSYYMSKGDGSTTGAQLPSKSGNFSAATPGTIWFDSSTGTIKYYGNTGPAQTVGSGGTFSGSLSGDVTGTQSATVVGKINGVDATTFTNPVSSATNVNTASTLMKRDASGDTNVSSITLNSSSNTYKVQLHTSASPTANYNMQLPPAPPASDGMVLASTTAGIMSWVNAAAGTITSVVSGTGIQVNTTGNVATVNLMNTSVSPGTYGTTAAVPVITVDQQGRITAATSTAISVSPTGSASGDLSGSYPSPTVAALRGVALSATAPNSGNVIHFDGTNYIPAFPVIGDLHSKNGGTAIPNGCSANQALVYSATSDTFLCSTISSIDPTAAFAAGLIPNANLPGSAYAWVLTGNDLSRSIGTVAIGASAAQAGNKLEVQGGAIAAGPQGTATGQGGEIRLYELAAAGTDHVGFRAPDALGGSTVYTLPAADGSSGALLSTNGSGSLSWVGQNATGLTSVGLSMPGVFSVSNSPLASNGTIAVSANGTAGGIPFFSASNTMASSAALAPYGLVVGGGTSGPSSLAAGGVGTLLTGQGSANPSFSGSPTLGSVGSGGALNLAGSTSGVVTIQPQAAAGTYNFNLPTTAGTSGQALLSGGGGTNAMAFGTLGVAAGGTGITSGSSGGIPYFNSASSIASSAALSANQVVLGGGAGAAPTVVSGTGTAGQILTSAGAGVAPTWAAAISNGTVSGGLGYLAKFTASDTVGNSALYETGGKIGLGNTAPDTKLHITGTSGATLKIVDGNQSNGRVLTSDANGVASWMNPAVTGLSSVGLTMPGIFSVANSPLTANGTIAVTASGTSGGIPYFSAANTLASSGALTNHGLIVGGGAGAAPVTLSVGGAGTILTGVASSNPAFSSTPTLGVSGSAAGTLALAGSSSGAVTLQTQAAAGTYNFNLPITAGTTGQALLSGGGGSNAMAYGTLSVGAGGTGLTSGTQGGVPYFSSSSGMGTSAAGTSGQVLTSGGTGAPTWAAMPTSSQWTTTGSDIYYSTGKVGIGSASPQVPLDVAGNAAISGNLSAAQLNLPANSAGNGVFWGANIAMAYVAAAGNYFPSTAIGDVAIRNTSGKIHIGNNGGGSTAEITVSGGKVGINSAAPGSALDVVGNIVSSGTVTAANISLSGSQAANTVYAAPSGGAGAPAFRTLAQADIPNNIGATSTTVSGANTFSIPTKGHSLQNLTMAASATITVPAGSYLGQMMIVTTCQNSTGGYTPTFAGASGVTLRATYPAGWPTTLANKCDVCGWVYYTTNSWMLTGCNLNE